MRRRAGAALGGLALSRAREIGLTRAPATAQRDVANWWVRWAGERTHGIFCAWKYAVNQAARRRRLVAAVGAPVFVPGGA